ncbi:DUF1624 domain-containing protein [Nitrospirillum sp. BR 11163]|uniref:DUF1624 domain-containing protein n=1 Tax=Nitrospirillum sp. BR 11163 TaxID=3104323 RepID=UPI002AFE70F7|nr:heparan-alpha-glucosaminide N-acetyltransferase domain-containing protein [Nitrospirillum sp. BR 11163]MEA1671983.1 heparan-alpha-glucosaminide N-acetyltransferase domain-containing protein [Nitrospirillum sp. BR 11163]
MVSLDGKSAPYHLPAATAPMAKAGQRLTAIDALRGLVMLFMLVDHVRETLFLHMQVTDPVDAHIVAPALFFTRLLSTFCAPTFIALTGLSAWLYGQSHSRAETSMFLIKRGAFLIFLELTFVGFAWTAQFPPQIFWLQVIWCIGFCMIALAGLLYLPRPAQLTLGIAIIAGHNLLDGIVLTPASPFFAPWAILHQRALIDLGGGLVAKTTYPVLPWIGVILLGYTAGPWFARGTDPAPRTRRLALLGLSMLAAFVVLRGLNVYGDKPWFDADTGLRTVMSFLSLTKYPPSLLFLLLTLGVGTLLLALCERMRDSRAIPPLALFGGAPMFFYLLHLYVLKALYLAAFAVWGPNKGTTFGVDYISTMWVWVFLLVVPLYLPTRWFARLKQRRKDLAWLKYL